MKIMNIALRGILTVVGAIIGTAIGATIWQLVNGGQFGGFVEVVAVAFAVVGVVGGFTALDWLKRLGGLTRSIVCLVAAAIVVVVVLAL